MTLGFNSSFLSLFNALVFLQSATLSGISWYDLSSVEIGLIVSFYLNSYFLLWHTCWEIKLILVFYLLPSMFLFLLCVFLAQSKIYLLLLWCKTSISLLWNLWWLILQTSGSLYGALIGSLLAFNIADFLGWYSFGFWTFQVWNWWLLPFSARS